MANISPLAQERRQRPSPFHEKARKSAGLGFVSFLGDAACSFVPTLTLSK